MIRLYNTYTRSKEEFTPVFPGEVRIYGCGVTPYKPAHLGHAMQAVIFDVIRRFFEYKGYKTTYVRNYTDIDDKIIDVANELEISPLAHSKNIMRQSDEVFDKLRIRRADVEPKVSETIPDIIKLIQELIDKGYGYVTPEGNVYYSVRKFKNYGKLSNQNLDDLMHGTRKEVEPDKKDPLDFALWKKSRNDEIFWESPWGKGRPGWHIECSAMSSKFLGDQFDIHGGGEDLVFPHHENEIAQSEAAHDGKFANYWMHNGLLMVGNEKMSKSLGNDISIKTWLENYHEETIRYLILTNHYRSHVQFVPERYAEANEKVYTSYKTLQKAQELTEHLAADPKLLHGLMDEFDEYMSNDFNTVLVTAMLNRLIKELSTQTNLTRTKTYVEAINNIGKIIGLFDLNPALVLKEMNEIELKKRNLDVAAIDQKIAERKALRAEGKYQEADAVRKELLSQGIKVQDTELGTEWEFDFSKE
jgi:cysteinyl-tRNA synthetase